MYDARITLLAESFDANAFGEMVSTTTSHTIWAQITSTTRAEFYAAGEHGHKPSLVAITHYTNYGGEELVSLNGKKYVIYRTYRDDRSDDIELYLERRVGNGTDG